MDKQLIANKFSKSLMSYNDEAIAQKQIVNRLFDILNSNSTSEAKHIFEFGSGTGLLSKKIVDNFSTSHIYLNDLSEAFSDFLHHQFTEKERNLLEFIIGDIEHLEFPKGLDLIISSSTEQWIENKTLFYKKTYDALKQDGLFVFSTFGPENLIQIRNASGKSLKYFTLKEHVELLSEYFEIIYTEEEKIDLNFSSGYNIISHLKKTGVNALSKETWTKNKLKKLITEIEQHTKSKEGYTISYHPMYFVLKKK